VVQRGRTVFELWTYIWTLTHGGGTARPRDEYRIQITGIQPPLVLNNTGGPTLLLGYEPSVGCFAGFDIGKHRAFSRRSPSIQIPITALHEALQFGLSFVTKGNDEIAIGIRPDAFLAYCVNAEALHREGANATMVDLLTKAASLEPVPPSAAATVSPERARLVREVSTLSRDSSFRRKVIHAYDRRCAVARMQLGLIDAAHILPVGIAGSTDDVQNGLCLSPTYHRAFDRAVIYLDERLQMQMSPAAEQELVQVGQAGGLEDFRSYLGKRIHLPEERALWPSADYVSAANLVRGIG
jgi:putative restriction endonuclease